MTGVFFFMWLIHCSGGWYYGSSAEREYNTSFLVERSVQMGQPIIAVAMNYRLASWGWLYSDEIVEEGATNVGMRDQRYGLPDLAHLRTKLTKVHQTGATLDSREYCSVRR